MQKTLHRADSRGKAEHGWLHSRHTFSFAGYHDPQRMQFGKLRVLNDDVVTGITHSEYNDSQTEAVNFLQIWVLPKQRDIQPRYGQRRFEPDGRRNRLQLVVSPDGRDDSLSINQDAWFSLVALEAGSELEYTTRDPAYGVYFFLLDGQLDCAGESLAPRDGMGISGAFITAFYMFRAVFVTFFPSTVALIWIRPVYTPVVP